MRTNVIFSLNIPSRTSWPYLVSIHILSGESGTSGPTPSSTSASTGHVWIFVFLYCETSPAYICLSSGLMPVIMWTRLPRHLGPGDCPYPKELCRQRLDNRSMTCASTFHIPTGASTRLNLVEATLSGVMWHQQHQIHFGAIRSSRWTPLSSQKHQIYMRSDVNRGLRPVL
jgi:hypothetical protein